MVSFVVGLLAGAAGVLLLSWPYGVLIGWTTAATVFVVWFWITMWPMGSSATAAHAVREDPGRAVADLLVLAAAVASLAAVGVLLAAGDSGGGQDVQAGMSVLSVALAWAAVHTVFTMRYARLYYVGSPGGIDFNEDMPPRYTDFAYLAFTIGMTFQVSDTALTSKTVRATALRHALLSYLFGAVIIAATINLVAGLAK
ncbi:DUF1345 domain-containing protein [Kutzneria sp. NPDC052558]|uniref:DUF1345 domain-containing protein n=1 Tax=Kutzneria sp. NPDC052558 TaxID=3364121 RepID=UPI0037CC1873